MPHACRNDPQCWYHSVHVHSSKVDHNYESGGSTLFVLAAADGQILSRGVKEVSLGSKILLVQVGPLSSAPIAAGAGAAGHIPRRNARHN